MTPSTKHPALESELTRLFGHDRRESITKDVCIPPPIGCGQPATDFCDKLSEKEFRISGLCQKCQDKMWPPEEA